MQLTVAPLLIHVQRSEALLEAGESLSPHWGLPSEGSVKGAVANTCNRIANTVMNMLFATNSLYPGLDSSSQAFFLALVNVTETLACISSLNPRAATC